jgi:hypothetical protein
MLRHNCAHHSAEFVQLSKLQNFIFIFIFFVYLLLYSLAPKGKNWPNFPESAIRSESVARKFWRGVAALDDAPPTSRRLGST